LLATIDAAASGLTLCRIAPGVQLVGPPSSGVSVLVVLTGAVALDGPGLGHRVARAGQLVLVPGGLRPQMACEGTATAQVIDGRDCLVRRNGWLVADATRGAAATVEVAAARLTATTERSLERVLIARLGDLPEGRQALAMLRAELARSAPGSGTLAVTLMSACIVIGLRIALAHGAERGPARSGDRRASIDRALAAVRSNPGDPHNIDTLADAAGMSRSTLTRYFRTVLSTTPTAFVQRTRLNEAAALLRSTALPIKAVAASAGFASRSHFSRAFAQAFGVDPSTYREQPIADEARAGR
jgi:AraC family transcriptional regulator, activator of mtrCDE